MAFHYKVMAYSKHIVKGLVKVNLISVTSLNIEYSSDVVLC